MPQTRRKPQYHATTVGVYDTEGRHHFFASSAAAWKVSYDLHSLITGFKRDNWTFNIFMVPGPIETPYRIEDYAPQVKGTVWLCAYGRKEDELARIERNKAAKAAKDQQTKNAEE